MRIIPKITEISLLCLFSAFPAFGHEAESPLPFGRPHSHELIEGHAHLGWESNYFSEGRDSLVAGSFALGRDAVLPGDIQLIDFNHWGVGLEWSF